MNLILLFPEDFESPQRVCLAGRRAHHVREVLRAQPGDTLTVGQLNGPLGQGHVVELTPLHLDVQWGEPPPRPEVTVVLAMVRPQIMKRTLVHLASLGIRRLALIGARRVEKAYFSQRLFDGQEYLEYLYLGLEQARDTWLPDVTIHQRFRPFVEDLLPELTKDATHRWLAHPCAGQAEESALSSGPAAAAQVLAVGPEGGWIPYEVDRFMERGFTPISLGPRILKVETALPYLFGRLGL